MKVAKDTFLIHVHNALNFDIGIAGANGNKITIDCDYNKYKHSTQIGQIFACPIKITSQYINDTPLNENDMVVFHHFVCQPDHKVDIGENIYRAEYFHIYAKVVPGTLGKYSDKKDAFKLLPVEDLIFVEPILEDENNLYAGNIRIKTNQENLKQQGIVVAASKKAQSLGLYEGDKIFFTASADYSMKIGDKDLYRMRIRNIVAVERDNNLVCLANKILVKEHPLEKKIGKFFDVRGSSEAFGVVVQVGKDVEGISFMDEISYYNGTVGSLNYNGEVYSFIEPRNINYLLEDMKARPTLDRIFIEQDSAEDKMGKFELADTAKERPRQGTVIKIGPGKNGIPMETVIGDRVIYGEFAGVKSTIEGKEYVILNEGDVLVIL